MELRDRSWSPDAPGLYVHLVVPNTVLEGALTGWVPFDCLDPLTDSGTKYYIVHGRASCPLFSSSPTPAHDLAYSRSRPGLLASSHHWTSPYCSGEDFPQLAAVDFAAARAIQEEYDLGYRSLGMQRAIALVSEVANAWAKVETAHWAVVCENARALRGHPLSHSRTAV